MSITMQLDAMPIGAEALPAGLAAMFAGLVVVGLIVALVLYIYMALALMTIAKKTNTEPAWLAWIPIANVWLMIKIAGLQWWWIFLLLLPIVPVIGAIAMYAAVIYIWWRIAEARKFPGWFALLMLIPLVNLVIVGIIAWKDK